jgi:anthranilate/para-aminobenzoate synthase component II
MILVVDMNWKKDSLAYCEFVAPIVSVVEPLEECKVKHFLELDAQALNACRKVVLSGTTLKDFATLQQIDKFSWVKTFSKPVLGICAGIQTICQVFGELLTDCLQVGITDITTVKENPLFEGNFRAYALHSLAVAPSQTFTTLAESPTCIEAVKHKEKEIYGVLFHPEVRNPEILQRFLRLK